ncbi:hypothetical protein CRG98_002666 [Punica granatum]|uniref:G-patch domain-containing protein n=1 Tax=Punica granatum TaxID=22663 RepID=A0A2I0L850_PUNGR|nr:hypothetical protein CRG98_002666 [Punica granatum]
MAEGDHVDISEEVNPSVLTLSQPPPTHAPPLLTPAGVLPAYSGALPTHLPPPASSGAHLPPASLTSAATDDQACIAALEGTVNQMATNMAKLLALLRGPNRASSSSTPPPGQGPTADRAPWAPPTQAPENHILSALPPVSIPALAMAYAIPPPMVFPASGALALTHLQATKLPPYPQPHAGFSYQVLPPINTTFHEPGTPTHAAQFASPTHFFPEADAEQERRLKRMEETIRALQASDARPDARYGDCSLFPGMRLPPKFKVLEFKTYEGTTDPRHHLRHYRGKMLPYWEYEEFEDLSRRFTDQYRYCAETPPTLLELSKKEMTRGQRFEEYAAKWRAQAAKHVPPISEAQQIQLFHSTLRGIYYSHLLAHTSSFSDLIEAGKKLDLGIKLGRMEDPTSKGEESSKKAPAALSSSGGRRAKEVSVNAHQPRSIYYSAPPVPPPTTSQSYDHFAPAPAQPSQPRPPVSRTPPPVQQNPTSQGQQAGGAQSRPRKQYSLLPAPLSHIYRQLLAGNQIQPISPGSNFDPIEETVGSIFSNTISFLDDELQSEGWSHSRALHIVCKCNNYIVGRVMIDNGSALNVCPVTTLKQMNVDLNRVRPSKTAIRAFDGSRREVNGEIDLLIDVGLCSFSITFQVLDIPNAFSLLLGRPWIHSTGAVPSSLHQRLKFIVEERLITVKGEEDYAIYKETAVPYISIGDDENLPFHSFETISVIRDYGESGPPRADRMIGKVLLRNNYVPGTGLGAREQGISRPIKVEGYKHRRGLGFRPSCHEIIEARKGNHLHRLAAYYGRLNRGTLVSPLSHFFPGPSHTIGGTLDGPSSDSDDTPATLSAVYAVTEEIPSGVHIRLAQENEELDNWTSVPRYSAVIADVLHSNPNPRCFDANLSREQLGEPQPVYFGEGLPEDSQVPEIEESLRRLEDNQITLVEPTEEINVGTEEEPRTLKIGTALDLTQRARMIDFLKEYQEVFAGLMPTCPA